MKRAGSSRSSSDCPAYGVGRQSEPAADATHRLLEAFLAHGLHEVVHRLHVERVERELLVRGEEDGERKRCASPLGARAEHGEPVALRHLDVEEDEIGGERLQRSDRRRTIATFSHDLHVGVHRQQLAHATARQRLVVDEQCSDHDRRHCAGRRATHRVPEPAAPVTCSVPAPPASAASRAWLFDNPMP